MLAKSPTRERGAGLDMGATRVSCGGLRPGGFRYHADGGDGQRSPGRSSGDGRSNQALYLDAFPVHAERVSDPANEMERSPRDRITLEHS